jgi:hypothetical protein
MIISRLLARATLLGAACAVVFPSFTSAQSSASIVVGKNVQITKDRARIAHLEPLMATDPQNPMRLLAASHLHYQDTTKGMAILYGSEDGGQSWKILLEPKDSTAGADVAMTYTTDGSIVFATLGRNTLYRSADGGRTWDKPFDIPPFIGLDREYFITDFHRDSKYYGRIYMNGTVFPSSVDTGATGSAIGLYTSKDGGKTFDNPILKYVPLQRWILGMANSVVLSDGSVVSLFGILSNLPEFSRNSAHDTRASLNVTISKDGGRTIAEKNQVSTYDMNRGRSEGAVIPWLAVDPGSPQFKDRLYVTWSDFRNQRLQVFISYSSDKGKTWSQPMVIDENRGGVDPKQGPDAINPVVAVNKNGVVAVTWYDRRDARDNLGWDLRVRASLDGGDTWLPSVKVSDQPTRFGGDEEWNMRANATVSGDAQKSGGRILRIGGSENNFQFTPGHTSGFDAGADGTFHAVWVDKRTGVAQLWHAPITVQNMVVAKNGGGQLADWVDLGGKYQVQLLDYTRDHGNNTLTYRARIKNPKDTSKTAKPDTLRGPVSVRVLTLDSDIALVAVKNADNKLSGPGAIWDFTSTIPAGGLLPDSAGSARELVFQLSDLRPFRQGERNRFNILSLTARVLSPPPPKKDTTQK